VQRRATTDTIGIVAPPSGAASSSSAPTTTPSTPSTRRQAARRWSFRANGPISGSATVLDGIVYFSTLAEPTYALDARTGRLLWTLPDGKHSPVVSDGHRLYLVGYTRLYGLEPAR
jgi:hypothetical protein